MLFDIVFYLHVQRFEGAILIDFVVIMLCLTCFTFNSAVSLVVAGINCQLLMPFYHLLCCVYFLSISNVLTTQFCSAMRYQLLCRAAHPIANNASRIQ